MIGFFFLLQIMDPKVFYGRRRTTLFSCLSVLAHCKCISNTSSPPPVSSFSRDKGGRTPGKSKSSLHGDRYFPRRFFPLRFFPRGFSPLGLFAAGLFPAVFSPLGLFTPVFSPPVRLGQVRLIGVEKTQCGKDLKGINPGGEKTQRGKDLAPEIQLKKKRCQATQNI